MLTHVKLLLGACPTNFSFTSSHATNHFSLAIFVFMTLQPLFKKYTYLFFVWAGIISYAQVYVGVHYPIDVIAGGIILRDVGWFSLIGVVRQVGRVDLRTELCLDGRVWISRGGVLLTRDHTDHQ
jgi:undecaprenyl-diphosphatase